jgi:hypothetical protein
MLGSCRKDEGVREGKSTTLRGRLYVDVHILTAAKTMWEVDETNLVSMTGRNIAMGAKLLGDRRVRKDDPRDRGSVIRPDINGRGGSGNATIGGWDA